LRALGPSTSDWTCPGPESEGKEDDGDNREELPPHQDLVVMGDLTTGREAFWRV